MELSRLGQAQVLRVAAADVAIARERSRRRRLTRLMGILAPLALWLWTRTLLGNQVRPDFPSLPIPPELVPGLLLILVLSAVLLVPMLGAGKSPHVLYRPGEIDTSLDDVKGAGVVVEEVTRTLNLFLAHRTFKEQMGGTPRRAILFEGPPGTGKTYLAQAFAAAAKTDLIRLQCFEGITEKQAIGSFDESLQRLFLETQRATLDSQWELLRNQLHTLDFFSRGPLLQAVLQARPVVLLIDELDKVDQKFEALLLEILSDWQITIPKLGTVKAQSIPVVVITSNQERRLGDPLRRRSLYKRIEHPDVRKEAEILDIRTVDAPIELKAQAVGLAQALRGYNLVKPPSIDEIVQFVRALQLLDRTEIIPADRDVLLPFLAKTEEDVKRLLLRDGFESLVATALEYRDQALAVMNAGVEKRVGK